MCVKKIIITSSIVSLLFLLSSCKQIITKEPITKSAFKLNTIVTVTIYDSNDTSLLDESLSICDKYENLFSRTSTESELYQLNHGLLPKDENGYVTISNDTFELISIGQKYSTLSDDSFNLAVEPLTSLWDFSSGKDVIPSDDTIKSVLPYLHTDDIKLNNPDKIQFSNEHMGIDLGGIAKGYIADKIAQHLTDKGVKSAWISLGGNVVCVGNKNGIPFTVGIQKPFADHNETVASMQINNKSVVSSGIYERFFIKDDILYHHILNPKTGYPYDNGLTSVTIVSDKSVDGDALSTTCFSLGLEDGLKLIESIPDADAVFIDKDGSLHYSNGFVEKYKVNLTN